MLLYAVKMDKDDPDRLVSPIEKIYVAESFHDVVRRCNKYLREYGGGLKIISIIEKLPVDEVVAREQQT